MALVFNVRTSTENAPQLSSHPEIRRGKHFAFIAVDIFGVPITRDDLRRFRAGAGAAAKNKSAFLDSLKSHIREYGLLSLRSGDSPAVDSPAAVWTDGQFAADITIPACCAFLLNAESVSSVLNRQFDRANVDGHPRPTFTLAGLKTVIRDTVLDIGRNGIIWAGRTAESDRAAFDLLPLLFAAPPAVESTESPAVDPAADTETVSTPPAGWTSADTSIPAAEQPATETVAGATETANTTESTPPANKPANRADRRRNRR